VYRLCGRSVGHEFIVDDRLFLVRRIVRLVESITGRGYRFVAPVLPVEQEAPAVQLATTESALERTSLNQARRPTALKCKRP
jgi:DNA-binding winged helix-turn-helix (wHTH) protein